MVNLKDINEFFKKVFGDTIEITIDQKVESTEKEQFQDIVKAYEEIAERDNKMLHELNMELSSYSEPFFALIDYLISVKYSEEIQELIIFYVYGRKDIDDNLVAYDEDEDGNPIYIKDFEDLWEQVNNILTKD
jgi:hypothetical protein